MSHLSSENAINIRRQDRNYALVFSREKASIEKGIRSLGKARIEHVGSSSVPGLGGQNVVDISVAISKFGEAGKFMRALTEIGYIPKVITKEAKLKKSIHVSKFDRGIKYHLHLEEYSENVENKIFFRDYLLKHPLTAKKYFELKKKWAKQAGNDWAKYSSSKSEFVQRVIDRQKKLLKKFQHA